MKKGGVSWQLVGMIMSLIFLVVIIAVIITSYMKAGNTLTECKANGGECLPYDTPHRERIMNDRMIWTDCYDLTEETGVKHECFTTNRVYSNAIVDENVPEGSHIYLLTYDEYPMTEFSNNPGTGWTFSKDPKLVKREEISGRITLEQGRLYAFQAYIKGQDEKYCSLYLREGGYSAEDNNYVGSVISKQECDTAESASSVMLYFVPRAEHVQKDLDVVLLPRKTKESSPGQEKAFAVDIIPILGPCDNRFEYGDDFVGPQLEGGSDLSGLYTGKYKNEPVSITVEDNLMRVEITNAEFDPSLDLDTSCLPIDDIFPIPKDGVYTFDFETLGLRSGTVRVKLFNVERMYGLTFPSTPILTYKYGDPGPGEWERAGDITDEALYAGNDFSFAIKSVTDTVYNFRFFPAQCREIRTMERCWTNSMISADDVLMCHWDNACVPCSGDVNHAPIQECEDYTKQSCLYDNDMCEVAGGRGCAWKERWSRLLVDKCVLADMDFDSDNQCAGFTGCDDYKSQYWCDLDPCNGGCEWKDRPILRDGCGTK